MDHERIYNVNIVSEERVPTPAQAKEEYPLLPEYEEAVFSFRKQVRDILDRKDNRCMVVVGPCSIHNTGAGIEYAERLNKLAGQVEDTMLLVMRVYFEKPRTTIGWKGFINDPGLDDSFDIGQGVLLARNFLLELVKMGLPAGTEALDPIMPQYIGDLITWTAIGARTTESQTHRELASGLSTPVGFKNGTDGNVEVAVNALESTARPHHFLGITQEGQCAVFRTKGNKYGHLVLRGGSRPNYDSASLDMCEESLRRAGLPQNIMVDCSHGNSQRDADQQPKVMRSCIGEMENGRRSILGFMIESNLAPGSQRMPADLSLLRPDISVTDPCLGWEDTEDMLREACERFRRVSGT